MIAIVFSGGGPLPHTTGIVWLISRQISHISPNRVLSAQILMAKVSAYGVPPPPLPGGAPVQAPTGPHRVCGRRTSPSRIRRATRSGSGPASGTSPGGWGLFAPTRCRSCTASLQIGASSCHLSASSPCSAICGSTRPAGGCRLHTRGSQKPCTGGF